VILDRCRAGSRLIQPVPQCMRPVLLLQAARRFELDANHQNYQADVFHVEHENTSILPEICTWK